MNKIENLKGLRAEIRRLEARRITQEAIIADDLRAIQESLSPGNMIFSSVSSVFDKRKTSADIVKGGVNVAIDFLFEKYLMKNSNAITRWVLEYVTKVFAGKLVDRSSGTINEKLKSVISSLKNKFVKNGKFDLNNEYFNQEY